MGNGLVQVAGQVCIVVLGAVLGALLPRLMPRSVSRRVTWRVCIVLVVVISVAYWAVLPRGPAISAGIQSPADGSSVDRVATLRGSLSGSLARGHTLWVVLKKSDEKFSHPQDRECDVDEGGWSCDDLYVGNPLDRGAKFEVAIYDADPDATAEMRQYGKRDKTRKDAYVGVDTLPPGMDELDANTVTRN